MISDRIAQVHEAHSWQGDILGCRCKWNWPEERTHFCGEEERIAKAHSQHVGVAIAEALGLAVEEGVRVTQLGSERIEALPHSERVRQLAADYPDRFKLVCRHATPWEAE